MSALRQDARHLLDSLQGDNTAERRDLARRLWRRARGLGPATTLAVARWLLLLPDDEALAPVQRAAATVLAHTG